jgi:predicted transcriptional regulator
METHNAVTDLLEVFKRLEAAMNNETRVMTCGEAAYILGRTPQTVSRYIADGRLKRARGNGVVGVRAKEVYSLLCQ